MRDIEFKALILAKLKKMEASAYEGSSGAYVRAMREGYLRAISELTREIIDMQRKGILDMIEVNAQNYLQKYNG